MLRRAPILVLALLLSWPAIAVELVANGGFESELSPAWQQEFAGAATMVNRATGYDGDPDFEVLLEKGTGSGYSKLNQIIVIPSADVDFAVNAKMEVSTTPGPWAAAGVALHYENQFGDALGKTIIVGKTTDCPWLDGDTLHMIPAPDEKWNNYGFNVADELANLPGVDMMAVHQIRISLFGQVGGDC